MRVVLYEFLNNISQNFVGPTLRTAGKKLYEIGNKVEGESVNEDRLFLAPLLSEWAATPFCRIGSMSLKVPE